MHIIYIFSDHKNRGYAPGLALGRCRVSKVSTNRLLGSLLSEELCGSINPYTLTARPGLA